MFIEKKELNNLKLVEEFVLKEKKNIKGVIFDCFGTLVEIKEKENPYKYLLEQIKILLKEKEVTTNSNEKIEQFTKTYKHRVMSQLFSLRDIELLLDIYFTDDVVETFHIKLIKELNSINFYNDSIEVLNSLLNQNIKVVICSNLEHNYADRVTRLLKSNNLSKIIPIFSSSVGYTKPQKEIYELCHEKIKMPFHDIVFVGDSYKNDCLEPYNYGYNAIWLNRNI